MTRTRGQAVLVAAAVVAVALAAMLLAAFQLGYQPATDGTGSADLSRVERPLGDAVRRGATDTAGRFSWRERSEAATVVRAELRPTIERIERSGVGTDVVYRVELNDDVAPDAASDVCPRGEDRRFGECVAQGALLFQERAGEAHVLGVVVEVRAVGPERATTATIVVEPDG